ncbi:ankyrin repeat-containing protein BDA1-like [Eucalyptus grandis]|uniref:ankyrin repeat-containing protein BDA1-like n=1 Tax=Eucalyptus grandis TaxID=71139 RepID=UPI00192EAE44|nr:ankyrin repeat-containing protein BDA1-like [Eucalyptus grandis]
MERRMLEAARKGDVHELEDLISSNELILEEMDLEGAGHTPLHVACVAGHLDFVRELLKRTPKLAEKVNTDGFSPLHIAAARGDVKIARELLTVGPHLCSVKGRERRIPLHYAAANGKVDVMKVLLTASPESVEETTAREETMLHLAVKNNRFDVVVVLVDHLKQYKKKQVINWKDHKGNTTLHLAAGKNFEAIRDRRGERREHDSGSTPLDVSTPSQREAGDREIRELLVRAGAKHGRGRSNSPASSPVPDDNDFDGANSHQAAGEEPVKDAPQSSPRSQLKNSNEEKESFGDIRNALLVVAALIASATYQSVLQPPKIIEVANNSSNNPNSIDRSNNPNSITEVAHNRSNNPNPNNSMTEDPSQKSMTEYYGAGLVYALFLGGNTLGFVVSVQMIICLTKDIQGRDGIRLLPLKLPLRLSLVAMVLTYFCFTLSLLFSKMGGKSPSKKALRLLPLMISFVLLLMQQWLAIATDFFLEWLVGLPLLGDIYKLDMYRLDEGSKNKDLENKDKSCGCK